MPVFVQDLIHKYELGAGTRPLKILVALVAVVALALFYNMAAFRNFSSPEAMDTAQLARNLSEGKGFTTDVVRPLALYVFAKNAQARDSATNSLAQAVESSPDISNPPAYPVLLAGVLKLMPFAYPDLANTRSFTTYAPEFWIAGFNQFLLLLCACLVFLLARRLFDEPVAWVSAAVFVGAELVWRHSVSGLPTLWLSFLLLLLALLLARLDATVRTPEISQRWVVALAITIGLLTALAGLTRYALLICIVPVVGYLVTLPSPRRITLTLVATFAFLLLVVPWLARNYSVSGTFFGTAAYSVLAHTTQFPGDILFRSLSPDFNTMTTHEIARKILLNLRQTFVHDLPALGGSWVTALFLAGLLVPFRSVVNARLRFLVLALLGILILAQAAISAPEPTQLAADYLMMVAPLIFIFGVSLLFNLLEQFSAAARYPVLSIFFLLACAPLVLAFAAPPPSPLAFPPYYPPWIAAKAAYTSRGEWMMSDLPWAVAWYGNRKAVWLPPRHGSPGAPSSNNFYSLHQIKPFRGLHISAATLSKLDGEAISRWRQTEAVDPDWESFRSRIKTVADASGPNSAQNQGVVDALMEVYTLADKHWVRGGGADWESFVLGILVSREVPTGFPLKTATEGLMPEIFLTDSERPDEKTIKPSK